MGRPINKRWFGTVGTGTGTGLFTGNNLPVRFKTGGTVFEGYIVSQKGSRTFVCDQSIVTSPPTGQVRATLVQGTNNDPDNNGEATLVGIYNGSAVTLRKLTNRVATDWSGNRYTWTLTDDSTETLLILTAI